MPTTKLENGEDQPSHPIATTPALEKRRMLLASRKVKSSHFNPSIFELRKDSERLASFTLKGEKQTTGGELRLLEKDGKYVKRLTSELSQAVLSYKRMEVYHLVALPEGNTPEVNSALRKVVLDMQLAGNTKRLFAPVAADESYIRVKDHLMSLGLTKPVVLVVPQDMVSFEELTAFVDWGIEKLDEVVTLYSHWSEASFDFLVSRARAKKGKLFMSGVTMNLTKHDAEIPLGPYLITQGFKGFSLREEPIPRFILKTLSEQGRLGIPKTPEEQYESATWLDNKELVNLAQHPSDCSCLGKASGETKDHVTELGVKACTTHHALEVFSEACLRALADEEERKRVESLGVFKRVRDARA